ncbi:hypothetical protein [Bradyrhizobium mercantei]|uniref:hypothetical protein n=1 Tax=Bradyrhizobium mercantei TaxID=1904807 RepID=UPI00117882ED|nr:hypothetical protein [Bradyrhizobium mercantei]
MVADDFITSYHFGGWDFGIDPDGNVIMTVIYLDPKTQPKSQAELDAAIRKISFRMPENSLSELGGAALRASEFASSRRN